MTVRGHLHERCPDQARGASGGIKVLQKYILFIYIIRFDSGPRHSGAAAGAHTPDKAAAVCRSPHGACGLRPLSRGRRRNEKLQMVLDRPGMSALMVDRIFLDCRRGVGLYAAAVEKTIQRMKGGQRWEGREIHLGHAYTAGGGSCGSGQRQAETCR